MQARSINRNIFLSAKEGCFDNRYFAEQPQEDRVVCELGIGMNPNITFLCRYTVLDEKMAWTFHIAGGTNKAFDHIDFVGYGNMEIIV